MALGGRETVGTAYVRIIADTSRLKRDVRDALEGDVAREMDKAGRQSAARFNAAARDELRKKHGIGPEIINQLQRDMGRIGARGTILGDDFSDNFAKAIRTRLQKADLEPEFIERFTRALDRDLREALIRGELQMKKLRNGSRALAGDLQHFLLRAERNVRLEMDREREASQKLADAEAKRLGDLEHQANTTKRLMDDFRAQEQRTIQATRQMSESLNQITDKDFARWGEDTSNALRRAGGSLRNFRDDVTDTDRNTSDLTRSMDRLIERFRRLNIARRFGAGARNDFVNAVGRIIGGLTELTFVAGIRAVRAVSRFRDNVRRVGPLRAFRDALEGLVRGFGKFIKVLPLAALALGGLFDVIGLVPALISDLAGAVTALASSISFGLVGALGALTPVATAAGIGLGVFVLGISGIKRESKAAQAELTKAQKAVADAKVELNAATPGTKDYTDAQKDLTKALKEQDAARKLVHQGIGALTADLTDWFHQAQHIAAVHLFKNVGDDFKLAKPAFDDFLSFIGKIADAESKVLDGFAKALASPAFTRFRKAMDKTMPGIVLNLGRAFKNVFLGLTGLLRGLLPFGDELSDNFLDMSRTFSDWANSARGQNAIKDFMDKAWASANKLWDLLKNLGKVIGDVLGQTRPTGDTLLDSMNDSLERLDDFLNSARGQRAIQSWMDQTEAFVHALGRAFGGLGRLFSTLNSADAQALLDALLDAIGGLASALSDVIPSFTEFVRVVTPTVVAVFKSFLDIIKPIFDFLAAHETTAKIVAGTITALYLAFKAFTLVRLGTLAVAQLAAFYSGIVTQIRQGNSRVKVAAAGFAAAIGGLVLASGLSESEQGGKTADTGKSLIGLGKAAGGGALIGGAIGSVIPGVGTLAGAGVGAIAGTVAGLTKNLIGLHHQTVTTVADSEEYQAAMQANAEWTAQFQGTVETLTSALEASNGELSKNVQGQVIQQLRQKGVLAAAAQAGIAGPNVVRAALGDVDKFNSVIRTLMRSNPAAARSLIDLRSALGRAARNFQLEADAAGKPIIPQNKLGVSLRKLRSALDTSNKFLKDNSAIAVHNRGVFEANVKQINKNVAAELRHGKSVKAVARDFTTQIHSLEENSKKLGFNRQEVADLIAKYGKVPKKVATELIKRGVLPAEIQAIIDKYNNIPPKKDTDVNANVHGQDDVDHLSNTIDGLTDKTVTITTKNIIDTTITTHGGPGGGAQGGASGGLFNSPELRLIGEAGPEALVPLRRPLSQVDPAVRDLSAFAQNKPLDNGGKVPERVVQNITVNVTPQTADPVAVATQVVNQAVALARV